MHLGISALLDFCRNHEDEESLVLATIIATEGSTYRKPGAMMLISNGGSFEGMISGGCLEGDLLHHASEVFASGQVKFVTYDMHAGEDLVWSLGLGCDGVIHLMLQRLDSNDNFGFFGQLEASQQSRKASLLALTTKPAPGLPIGGFAMIDESGRSLGEPDLIDMLKKDSQPWPNWRMRPVSLEVRDSTLNMILVNIPAQTRVLICGGGPDALPVARVLCELDWDVLVVDHRAAFAKSERFPVGCTVIRARPENLSEHVELCEIDAVVIMSHHLENDGSYLQQASAAGIAYIGVLGPRARRDRLRELSGCGDIKLYGPIGLDIGAELPGAIALSIAAEIHAALNQRNGKSLTLKTDD